MLLTDFYLIGGILYFFISVSSTENLHNAAENSSQVNTCSVGQFKCTSGKCIDERLTCDGRPDCKADSSDETAELCANNGCLKIFYRCQYGACVPHTARCNGVVECMDNSDEESCVDPKSEESEGFPPNGSCVIPNHPKDGFYTSGTELMGTTESGTHVPSFSSLRTRCNSSYKPFLSFNGGFSLCVNGKWEPPPYSCALSCVPVKSTSTTFVTCTFQGKPMPSCDTPFEGTLATITCAEMYEDPAAIIQIRVCTDGTWDRSFTQCVAKCGRKRLKATTNITGEEPVQIIEYPWHAGIYTNRSKEHLCGGSIINERAIVTGAHCFTKADTGEALPKEDYFIAVGKYFRKYNDERDKYAQYSKIRAIHIPTRYKGLLSQFEADIALVVLSDKLIYSIAVQPVCVDWSNKFEYQHLSGSITGVAVGWVQREEDQVPAEELKELKFPVIPYEQCYEQVPKSFRRYLTHDKICAGFSDGAQAPCQGGGGGSLTFLHTDDRYYIRGVVSVSPASAQGTCDSNQYGTYTLISKHIEFLKYYALSA